MGSSHDSQDEGHHRGNVHARRMRHRHGVCTTGQGRGARAGENIDRARLRGVPMNVNALCSIAPIVLVLVLTLIDNIRQTT